jgi:hypothetical protein
MGTEMVMLAVMGMEKTVQMAMKMVTINEVDASSSVIS